MSPATAYDCSSSHDEMLYRRGALVAPADQELASKLSIFNILQRPYQDLEQWYAIREKLGAGNSGVVRRCVERRTGTMYACKTIDKASLLYKEDVAAVRAELETMQVVSGHPAIVSLKGAFEDSQHLHFIMEFCEGGDLCDSILERKRYPENEAAEICLALVSAVAYSQQLGIMHRDLKPENIFLAARGGHTDIRLGDFGQAARFTSGEKLTQLAGSPFYIAPEVLGQSYGPEADFWSLGVILYILLAGVPPFWGSDTEGTFQRIKRGTFKMETGPWKQISEEAKDLLSRLLTRDPLERITAKEVMAHPWIVERCYQGATIPVAIPVETLRPSPASPQFPEPSSTLSPACQTCSISSSRLNTLSTQLSLLPLALPGCSPNRQRPHSRNNFSSTGPCSSPYFSGRRSSGTSGPQSVLPEMPKTGEPKSAGLCSSLCNLPRSDLQGSWQQHFGVASQPVGERVVPSGGFRKDRPGLRCNTSDCSPRVPSAGFSALAIAWPDKAKAHPSATLASGCVEYGSSFVAFQEYPRSITHVLIIPVIQQFSQLQLLEKNQSEAIITIHLSASPTSQVSAMEATPNFEVPGGKTLHLGDLDPTVQKFQRSKCTSKGRGLLACFGVSCRGVSRKVAAA